jgi:hypothetical protein
VAQGYFASEQEGQRMSTETDGLAPLEEAQVEEPVEPAAVGDETHAQETDDDKVEGAVEFKPGEKYVPLSAVIEARKTAKEAKERLKELEPASQEAAQLRQWINENKAYIDFIRTNPDFMRQPAAPQKTEPQHDAEAEEVARDLELYTKDGTLDIAKGRRIIDRNVKTAREAAEHAAQSVTAPINRQVESHAVMGVLQRLQMEKDGDGQPIDVRAVNALAEDLVKSLGQDGARRFIAQDGSYDILTNMAWGKHAKLPKKGRVAPPAHDPLPTERAGGRTEDVVVSTQHLGKLGMKEESYKASAKKFRPGQFNSLED